MGIVEEIRRMLSASTALAATHLGAACISVLDFSMQAVSVQQSNINFSWTVHVQMHITSCEATALCLSTSSCEHVCSCYGTCYNLVVYFTGQRVHESCLLGLVLILPHFLCQLLQGMHVYLFISLLRCSFAYITP
jgi:hypothetical protein